MAINCPYCRSSITVKNVKPGRFAPKCPKCTTIFFLEVRDDADAEADWIVALDADALTAKSTVDSTDAPTHPESQSLSMASTKQIRAVSSPDDSEASGGVQPLTKKTAAADTERIMAVPDSLDEESDDD